VWRWLYAYKNKNFFSELYGVDVSSTRLKKAREEIIKLYPSEVSNFRFIEGDLDKKLSFPDNYFDVVICVAVMEHVFDIFSLVGEIHRILRPNGYAIVQVPNICYLRYRIQFLLGKLPATSSPYDWQEVGWEGGHIHYFTMNKFCWLFEQQGFKIEKRLGSGFLAPFCNWWPSLLTGDLVVKARKEE